MTDSNRSISLYIINPWKKNIFADEPDLYRSY